MQQNASDQLRDKRWQDFRRRAEFAPATVYRHRTLGWEYIPIHPFGDELDELQRLGLTPQACRSVDAWWGINGDRTLLESRIVQLSSKPCGLYAKATDHVDLSVYLEAVLDGPYITRTGFEDAMAHFATAGFPSDPRFQLRWGDPWLEVRRGPAAA